ncbi:MAG: hypothetical protein ACK5GN_07300 [Pseudomonadota bacterium]
MDPICAGLAARNISMIEFDFSCESANEPNPTCPHRCDGQGGASDPDTWEYIGLTPQDVANLEGYGSCLRYYAPYSATNLPSCSSCTGGGGNGPS